MNSRKQNFCTELQRFHWKADEKGKFAKEAFHESNLQLLLNNVLLLRKRSGTLAWAFWERKRPMESCTWMLVRHISRRFVSTKVNIFVTFPISWAYFRVKAYILWEIMFWYFRFKFNRFLSSAAFPLLRSRLAPLFFLKTLGRVFFSATIYLVALWVKLIVM